MDADTKNIEIADVDTDADMDFFKNADMSADADMPRTRVSTELCYVLWNVILKKPESEGQGSNYLVMNK